MDTQDLGQLNLQKLLCLPTLSILRYLKNRVDTKCCLESLSCVSLSYFVVQSVLQDVQKRDKDSETVGHSYYKI